VAERPEILDGQDGPQQLPPCEEAYAGHTTAWSFANSSPPGILSLESLDNLTLANVYLDRGKNILKRQAIQQRCLQHRAQDVHNPTHMNHAVAPHFKRIPRSKQFEACAYDDPNVQYEAPVRDIPKVQFRRDAAS